MIKIKQTAKIVIPILVILVGLGVALYPTLTNLRYNLFQRSLESILGDQEGLSSNILAENGAVAKLVIPKIRVEAYVLKGTEDAVLNKAVGHYKKTPLPGYSGNSAMAGHRTMYGQPFRDLDQLDVGDKIVAFTDRGKYTYEVQKTRIVKPTDDSVLKQGDDSLLTLTTCNPVGSDAQRLVVIAKLVR